MSPAPLAFALFVLSAPLPGLVIGARAGLHRAGVGRAIPLFLALVLSLGVTSVVALAAAAAGVFSLGLVAGANVLLALLLSVAGGLPSLGEALVAVRARPLVPRPRHLAAALLLAVCGLLYARPYEYFPGGWDPGVYVNTGASIARTGSIGIHDAALAGLPAGVRELFLHQRRGLVMKYPGFVLRDQAAGRIQPYFNHLFPVWIAILDAGLGPAGGLFTGPVFMVLSVAALLALGTLLFGSGVGLTAAGIFGLSIPAIFQARFPTAEPLAMLFTLGAWSALVLFVKERRPALAAVAGFLIACGLLAKITTLLPTLVLLGAAFALVFAVPSGGGAWIAAAAAAATAVVVPVTFALSREYADEVFGGMLVSRLGPPGPRWALAIAAAAAALWCAGALARRSPAALRRVAGALAIAAGGVLYFLRPLVDRSRDAGNLVELGWFVTPLALLLALGGLLAVLRDPGEGVAARARLLFATVFAVTTLAVLYRKAVTPFYLWALRRYVPEILPALSVLVAVALAAVRARTGRAPTRPRLAAAAALLLLVVGGGLYRGRHLLAYREYAGAGDAIARTAALLPAGAITFCPDAWLATPLQYVFGRETLAVSDATPEKSERIAAALADLAAAGRPVWLAVPGGGEFFSRRLGLRPAGEVDLDLPQLERTARHYPVAVGRFATRVGVFQVVPFSAAQVRRPTRIAVATAPFGLLSGFFGPEHQEGDGGARLFRWTGGEPAIEIPEPPDPGRPWEIELVLAGGRPAGQPDPVVEVLLDGRPVGSLRAGAQFATYRVAVPPGAATAGAGYHELALRTETYTPAQTGGARDARALGVMWESAAVRQ